MDGHFEIREYIDESGAQIRSEVVDVDSEVKGLQRFIDENKSKLAGKTAADASIPDEKKDALLELLGKLSALDEASELSEAKEESEESQFIRALGSDTEAGSMEAQSSRVIDDNFDFLDRLEQLEAQERSTASATAAAGAQSSSSGGSKRKVASSSNSSSSSSSSAGGGGGGGWKKGFLSGSKPKSKSQTLETTPAATATAAVPTTTDESVPMDISSLNISTPASLPSSAAADVRQASPPAATARGTATSTATGAAAAAGGRAVHFDSSVESAQTESPPPPAPLPTKPKPAPRSTAFTGKIVERFP